MNKSELEIVFPEAFNIYPNATSLKELSLKSKTPFRVNVPQAISERIYTTERVGISRKTHDEHLRLWQGYARKTNEIRERLESDTLEISPAKANSMYSEIRSLKIEYTFSYQGLCNHNIYFDTIGGKGGVATGKVLDFIKESYGTFEAWEKDWIATGISARGWVFLAFDHQEGRLFNYIGDTQNTFPMWDHTCILAMDVYEHAYFYDFQTSKLAYIEAYMKVIDWDRVNVLLSVVN